MAWQTSARQHGSCLVPEAWAVPGAPWLLYSWLGAWPWLLGLDLHNAVGGSCSSQPLWEQPFHTVLWQNASQWPLYLCWWECTVLMVPDRPLTHPHYIYRRWKCSPWDPWGHWKGKHSTRGKGHTLGRYLLHNSLNNIVNRTFIKY